MLESNRSSSHACLKAIGKLKRSRGLKSNRGATGVPRPGTTGHGTCWAKTCQDHFLQKKNLELSQELQQVGVLLRLPWSSWPSPSIDSDPADRPGATVVHHLLPNRISGDCHVQSGQLQG